MGGLWDLWESQKILLFLNRPKGCVSVPNRSHFLGSGWAIILSNQGSLYYDRSVGALKSRQVLIPDWKGFLKKEEGW